MKARLSVLQICLAVVLVALIAQPGAAGRKRMQPGGQGAATAANDDLDPGAMSALEKMGAYLRSLKSFQVRSTVNKEDVLDDGQKIQYGSTVDILAQMPDRLRFEVEGDRNHRGYLYDGTSVTVWQEAGNFYATAPAPGTVVELANTLADKYGIEIPLEDLFYWGTQRSKTDQLKGAMDVGPSQIEGVTCEHYAFRQDGLDWQVWIQLGDYPLPRKLVITTLTDDARPEYSAVLTWNLAPSYNEATFKFDPPPDARKIKLAEVKAEKEKEQ